MAGIGEIAAKGGVKYDDASKTLKGLVALIQELPMGEKITVQGLGTFSLVEHASRTGRNPQSGEPVEVPAKTVPKLAMNRELKLMIAARIDAENAKSKKKKVEPKTTATADTKKKKK